MTMIPGTEVAVQSLVADGIAFGQAQVNGPGALTPWSLGIVALVGGQPVAQVVLNMTEHQLDTLAGMVTEAVAAVKASNHPTLEAVPEPDEAVLCKHCTRRIFGDAADRGSCFACDPEDEEVSA